MSMIYDNWERLVAAALKKEQLWKLFHEQSRSPSILSEESNFGSSFRLSSSLRDVAFDFSSLHDHSRSYSILSEASDFGSSFNLESSFHDLAFDFSSLGSSSPFWEQKEEAFSTSLTKVVLISDFSPAFDVEDAVMAYSELLGRGSFGSAYTVLMNSGVKIVVKRLESASISELEFKRNMEIIGNVKHENVVALRAYYFSQDEMLMLYDHYSKGSVSALLQGGIGKNRVHLDWESRVRIAIGAARGIAEIHAKDGGKLVHGNIKASNIFLNSQHYGCVSDHGLASMISSTFMPTGHCYSPEVNNTQDVTQASDVYSFGILLLELLTRKSSVYIPDGPQDVDLVKLVTSVKSKEWAAKAFDVDLLKHPEIKEQMIKMLKIGISCVAKSPKKRPKMSKLVKMLEGNGIKITRPTLSLEQKLVFVEGDYPTFELEDMFSAFAVLLEKGRFGTSYKVLLENGTTIWVKRLKDVNATFKEFQQHMEVIGRMRHTNVAKLRAYYFSNDEKLLVYDYFNQNNVSTLLHSITVEGSAPLDWETRLNIAVGAARGLAHIHRQDGQTLVHGNIKTSNIFLNGQHGLVSDAGLAKVTQVANTIKLSQAYDVYCFGVVLLELVSGKPSQYATTDGDGDVISLVNWTQSFESTDDVYDIELLRSDIEKHSMHQLQRIAMKCVDPVPEQRPKMHEVLKMLEEVNVLYSVDQLFLEPRLEELLEDLLCIIHKHSEVSFNDEVLNKMKYLDEEFF